MILKTNWRILDLGNFFSLFSRINECIKKEKLEVNGVHRDEMASTLRRSLSQYPIEVIDQMIDRKGKKPQDMKSLSTKTLEGFYVYLNLFCFALSVSKIIIPIKILF